MEKKIDGQFKLVFEAIRKIIMEKINPKIRLDFKQKRSIDNHYKLE